MKRFFDLCGALLVGVAALVISLVVVCRCCRPQCPPPRPCKMTAPCHPHKKHHRGNPAKMDKMHHRNPAMLTIKKEMKTRMETLRTLREKYPDEMLAIDKEFVAAEDKIAALAAKDGLKMPKHRIDFRRIRIAFPEEMKALDAQSKTMKPHEYFQAVKKLAEKLNK